MSFVWLSAGVAAAIALAAFVRHLATHHSGAAERSLFNGGDPRLALAAAELLLETSNRDASLRVARHQLAMASLALTDTARMVSSAEALVRQLRPADAFNDAVGAVNAFICAGRYREALAAGEAAGRVVKGHVVRGLPDEVLLEINLAEAEYNLGEWDAAWARLAALDETSWSVPILIGGLRLQRAWILAHRDEVETARGLCEQVRIEWFPRLYQAEFHLCRALVELEAGDFSRSLLETEKAAAISVRASSQRNGLFLRAMALHASGEREKACSLFAEAAAHPYRGQGGAGLLAWGDCLIELGDAVKAAEAWALCVDRDPQSESAASARRRLTARG